MINHTFRIWLISLLIFLFLPMSIVFADYADGTYEIPFEMKEAGSDNTSIADSYFKKPANLSVNNGNYFIEMTITSSEWVKSLSGPYGAAKVLSEDQANNERVVQIQVDDLKNPVPLKMHVVVPEEIAGMPYDHEHTVRAVFNASSVPTKDQVTEKGSTDTKQEEATAPVQEAIENPPTNDSTPIVFYTILLIGAIAFFGIYRIRFARN